jgi:hypothetical protein
MMLFKQDIHFYSTAVESREKKCYLKLQKIRKFFFAKIIKI